MSRSRAMTDRELRSLAGPCERAVGGVAGLYVKVRTSGVRTLAVRYRFGGDLRFVNLGRFPSEISLAAARDKAAELRRQVRDGRDPAGERAEAQEALRMSDFFGDVAAEDPKNGKLSGWYLETYVRTAGQLGTAKTAKGIANDRSAINKYLRSRRALMRKRVNAVTASDLNKVKASAPASTWRKLRNILVVCFRYAEEIGERPPGSNPALQTKASTDRKRERFLTPAERERVEDALRRAEELGPSGRDLGRGDRCGLSPHLVRALRILILTGMRRGDVVGLTWAQVDWRHRSVRLTTGKTGARVVPLSPQAVRYLRREQGRGGGQGLICPTESGRPVHPDNISRAWNAIREIAELDGNDGKPAVRLHDLRHSWASDAVSAGVPLYVVGAALGHRQPNTTARYAHLHDAAIRQGLDDAGAAIEAATAGGEST